MSCIVACGLSSSAFAAEPTFTKGEVQAAYMLGKADAMREQLSATPAARSMAEKMKQSAQPAPVKAPPDLRR